eukprot:3633997-Lingulodinium_polyedra.AAC.1
MKTNPTNAWTPWRHRPTTGRPRRGARNRTGMRRPARRGPNGRPGRRGRRGPAGSGAANRRTP